MPLVQVIARRNGRIVGAQPDGKFGVALKAYLQRPVTEVAGGEHLAADLEHRHLVAERKVFMCSGQRQAPCPEFIAVDARTS